MEYYKEPVNKKPIQKKLRRLSVYAVIITVIAVGSLTLLLLLGLAYRTVLKSFEEQSLQLGEVTGENKSMSEDVRELEESNDILTASNEKLAEDVDFYSRIMDENQLRKEIIRLFEERNSTYNVLKKIYPDKLVLLDGGQFNFFDINRELTPCEYTREYFVYDEDSGEMTYAPDGETSSIKGIDVSKYNGKINWEKVASSGVKYVYIRAGVRGYVSGEIVKDDTFEENIEKAKKAGLAVGVYFFSQAVDEKEAEEEADFVLECMDGKDVDCPVVIDIEKIDNPDTEPRTLQLSQEQRTDVAAAFCERIKEAGYTPMIYGNLYTFLKLLDMEKLEEYDKWFADYISEEDRSPYFAYKFRVWQYASDGKCPGVSDGCDVNIAFY